MARRLARKVGYAYIDSGAMYRAVTLYALRHGMIAPDGTVDVPALEAALPDIHIAFHVDPATGMSHTYLNGHDVETEIRSMEVSGHVSPIAAIPAVRRYLTRQMADFGREKGIVMDGRDIGTAVFPQAELKVFVDASPQVRARRRYDELKGKGQTVNYEDVLANVMERDRIDRTRATSPLRQAEDAIVLNNDAMTPEEQDAWLLTKFQDKAK